MGVVPDYAIRESLIEAFAKRAVQLQGVCDWDIGFWLR
jgi:hypothetical protein